MANGKIIYQVEDVVGVHPEAMQHIEVQIDEWRRLYLKDGVSPELKKQARRAAEDLQLVHERWVSTGRINRTDEPTPL